MRCRVGRFHNIFGPEGTWRGGKEKAPAAVCRKVAEASNPGTIEIWGDGKQTRSFLYIEECLEGVLRLMRSDFTGPVNIGSDEMVTINQMARMVIGVSGKKIDLAHIPGPTGVRGRNSDNRLIEAKLGWRPTRKFIEGLERTYAWIEGQVAQQNTSVLAPEPALKAA
jgi:nucleoside-diphosphate-sugar epimerase